MAKPPSPIIAKDQDMAASLGITATPAFLVGTIQPGRLLKVLTIVSGARPIADFRTALDKAIGGQAAPQR
jgi:protein-disulfide isomerase